ncbi:MAG: EAL domain-containing protein [Ilumatobacteraceae bacterium]|nr:EAL domain-containing protein [Ilumatobacteraceae bacterium]
MTLLAASAVWLVFHQIDAPAVRRGGHNIMLLAVSLAATGCAGWKALGAAGPSRRYLISVAGAAASWTIGQGWWTVNELILDRISPFPSVGDLGFLFAYPLVVAGLLRAPRRVGRPGASARRVLDALLFATSLGYIVWAFALHPFSGALDLDTWAGSLGVLYPLGDVVLTTVAVAVFATARPPWRRSTGLVAVALATFAVADTAFSFAHFADSAVRSPWIDLGWIVGWVLITSSVFTVPAHGSARGPDDVETPSVTGSLLPVIAVAAVAVVQVGIHVVQPSADEDRVLGWLGIGALGLLAARSLAAHREQRSQAVELAARDVATSDLLGRHRVAFTAAQMGTWYIDLADGMVRSSPELDALLGYGAGYFDGSFDQALSIVVPDDLGRYREAFRHAIATGEDIDIELQVARADGRVGWARVLGRTVADEDGEIRGIVGVIIDIADRVAASDRLARRAEQSAVLVELGQRAVASASLDEAIEDAVASVAATLDAELAEVLRLEPGGGDLRLVAGRGWAPGMLGSTLVPVGNASPAGVALAVDEAIVVEDFECDGRFADIRLLRARGVRSGVSVAIRSGSGPWGVLSVHSRAAHVFTAEDANFLRAVANTIGAVAGRAEATAALVHRGLHDPLTELPNRALLQDRLDVAIVQTRAAGRNTAVVHISMDRFTLVNDSLGHEAGDRALIEIADRLGTLCGPGDTVARLQGDEFVVAATVDDGHEAMKLASLVLATVAEPIVVSDPAEELFLTASVGVALANGVGDTASVLRDAGIAANRAREQGGRRYELFDDCVRIAAVERLRIERELRYGIAEGQFEPHYQPLVRLSDGALIGVEALARWRHPTRGLLGPGAFIGPARSAGLLAELGRSILEQAILDTARWNSTGATPLRVSVNLAAEQLDATLADIVRDVLRSSGLDPRSLCLEVVEDALMQENDAAIDLLGRVRDLGVSCIEIDDFGTGSSSLSRLARFPVTGVKIDRSFITDIATSADDRTVAGTIVHLGHGLGLSVTAEGIETHDQLDIVRALGCDSAQGWLFAPALPADEIPALHAVAATAFASVIASPASAGASSTSLPEDVLVPDPVRLG